MTSSVLLRAFKEMETLRHAMTADAKASLLRAQDNLQQASEQAQNAEYSLHAAETAWHDSLSAGTLDPDQLQRLAAVLVGKKSDFDTARTRQKRAEALATEAQLNLKLKTAEEKVSETIWRDQIARFHKARQDKEQDRREDRVTQKWCAV